MSDSSQSKIGVHRFSTLDEARQAVIECASLATRTIDIFSGSLSADLWGTDELTTELSRVARIHRLSQVRILVQNTKPLYGRRHQIIDLYRRLPSRTALLRLDDDCESPETAFCIADSRSMTFFNNESIFEGFFCELASAEAKHALAEFNHLWHTYGLEDPELKSLSWL